MLTWCFRMSRLRSSGRLTNLARMVKELGGLGNTHHLLKQPRLCKRLHYDDQGVTVDVSTNYIVISMDRSIVDIITTDMINCSTMLTYIVSIARLHLDHLQLRNTWNRWWPRLGRWPMRFLMVWSGYNSWVMRTRCLGTHLPQLAASRFGTGGATTRWATSKVHVLVLDLDSMFSLSLC